MTALHLTDAQRDTFAACGIIVIDGEPAERFVRYNSDQNGTYDVTFDDARLTIAPEGWRILTEPCDTCSGKGKVHDHIDRHVMAMGGGYGWDPCPNPDCVGGCRVVTLTATCRGCNGTGQVWYDEDTPMAGQITPHWRKCPNGYQRYHCDGSGVVTLGRFTIPALLPVVDGWHHDWDVEKDGPAVIVFDPPYTQPETGQVWTIGLYKSWGEYDPLTSTDPPPRPGQFVAIPEAVA
jgi:hypothetical protein